MTLAVVHDIPRTQPSAALDGATTGLGILVPISPLTGENLQVETGVIDGVASPTVLVETVPPKPAATTFDTRRWFTKVWLRVQAAASKAAETAREVADWLIPVRGELAARRETWRRRISYRGRHAVSRNLYGGQRSTLQHIQALRHLRAAGDQSPEGHLALTVTWVQLAVEALRDHDAALHPVQSPYPQGGYQFRCS